MSMSDACVCAKECTLDLVAMRKGMNIQEKDTLSSERSLKNSTTCIHWKTHQNKGYHFQLKIF